MISNNNVDDIKLTKIDLLHLIQQAATREDINQIRSEIKSDNNQLRNEMQLLRSELKEDMSHLRSELREDMSHLRSELKEDMSHLRSELKEDNSKFAIIFDKRITKLEDTLFRKKDAYVLFGILLFALVVLTCFLTYFATDKIAILIQLLKTLHTTQ